MLKRVFTSAAFAAALSLTACGGSDPKPGTVRDEAMLAGRTAASFPAADEDYFHTMFDISTLTGSLQRIPGAPRWFGAELRYNW